MRYDSWYKINAKREWKRKTKDTRELCRAFKRNAPNNSQETPSHETGGKCSEC